LSKENVNKGGMALEKFFHFRLEEGIVDCHLLNTRVYMMSGTAYATMYKKLFEKFSTAAASILFEMGQGYGEGIGKILKTRGTLSEIANLIPQFLAAAGWGKFFIETDEKSFKIKIENNMFSESVGNTGTVTCFFIVGWFLGVFKQVGGGEWKAVEEKCTSKGDPFCEIAGEKTTS